MQAAVATVLHDDNEPLDGHVADRPKPADPAETYMQTTRSKGILVTTNMIAGVPAGVADTRAIRTPVQTT